jgi:hypothetical protein
MRPEERECGAEKLAVLNRTEQMIRNEHNVNYGGSLSIGYPIPSNDRACQDQFKSSCGKALHRSL